MKLLFVFFSIFVSDAIWTFYISAVSKGKPMLAGVFSALTIAFGMAATIVIVQEPAYLLVAIIAAWSSTFISVAFLNRR